MHPPKHETFDLRARTNTDPKGIVRAVDEYVVRPWGLYLARPTPGRAQFHYLESWLIPSLGLRATVFHYNPGHERVALLLRADTVALRRVDAVRGAVAVDDVWVVHGDIRRPAVEIIDGITAFAHHLGHQPIGGVHRTCRIVDEAGLHLLPPGG